MGAILVTHPARQHSHQLARALFEREQLRAYWTGVPAADPRTKGPLYRFFARLSPQPTVGLPASMVRHHYTVPLTARVTGALLPTSQVSALRHWADAQFDAWASRRLPNDIEAVVCYENAALGTFRKARRKGITTILDAASFHYTWQDQFYEPVEAADAHEAINARKEKEIHLADHILTVSELARESYLDAGVLSSKVTSVPMGADLSNFVPSDEPIDSERPFTFLFAGHAAQRKGVDLLLRASEQLKITSEHDHQVWFAGGSEEGVFQETSAPIETMGFLDHPSLAETFQRADCLVLPSRHDSFGRVVVEAMATGLPVLVSEHVGAKEVVEEGKNGWIIPAEDVGSLVDQMRWCIENSDKVRTMREPAMKAAQQYSWAAYRTRVVEAIGGIVQMNSKVET